jgi:aminoglycoside phosphotransferase
VLDQLPASIAKLVDLSLVEELPLGRLKTAMFIVREQGGVQNYLKIGRGISADDLVAETSRLNWLAGRMTTPIPEVVAFAIENGTAFQLITRLAGLPAYDERLQTDRAAVVTSYALALKELHSTNVAECPFVGTIESELVEAERRLRNEELSLNAFRQDSDGQTPAVVLEWLHCNLGMMRNSVFTHGDFCMPNVLMSSPTRVSGLIDWGQAGVADIHRDLFGVCDSLYMNYGVGWEPIFFEAYGIDEIDPDRLRFIEKLDLFASHHISGLSSNSELRK